MNHHAVGWGGYTRLFLTEHVTVPSRPQHKYTDIEPPTYKVNQTDLYRTEYQSSHADKERLLNHHQKTKQFTNTQPLSSTTSLSSTSPSSLLSSSSEFEEKQAPPPSDGQESRPYTPGQLVGAQIAIQDRSTRNTRSTTYKSSISDKAYSHYYHSSASKSSPPSPSPSQAGMALNVWMDQQPHSHATNLLRGNYGMGTSYTMDYGTRGSTPLDRYDERTMKDDSISVTKMGTTGDLFRGTNKATSAVRVPGYAGYVPVSKSNTHSLSEDVTFTKNNILEVYRHDMPGYTGHKPDSVLNDRGPRIPTTKALPKLPFKAGLMVDSLLL